MATGAAATNNAFVPKNPVVTALEESNNEIAAATVARATTTTARRIHRASVRDARSAASSVAPCSTVLITGTQLPVGPDARKTKVVSKSSSTSPNRTLSEDEP